MKRKIFCFDFNGKKQSQSKGKKKPYIMEKILKVQTVSYTERKKLTIEEYL